MKHLILFSAFALLLLFAGCTIAPGTQSNSTSTTNSTNSTNNPTNTSLEYNYSLIAKNFIIHDETYSFDGIPGTLKLVNTTQLEFFAAGSYGWVYTYTFNSTRGGYGNRTFVQYLPRTPTSHMAKITVINGKVTSAIMDDIWDMQNESKIPGGKGDFCGGIAPAQFQCAQGLTCVLEIGRSDPGGTYQ